MTIALNPDRLADAVQVAGITGDQLVYVADSSNIEARMLAWLAGQDNLLEIFRSGGDVYANFASILFGRPIDKEVDKLERFIGKVCVLGLGYGMGWRKFRDTLAAGALGGDPVYFTEIEAQNAVNTYRAANAAIVDYWKQADAAIVDMYMGNSRQWGCLTIHRNCLVMPNGMALQYPGLRPAVKEDDKGNEFTDGWEYHNGKFWTKIYGGKLVENITQALSRIVLFTQMLNINKRVFVPVGGRVALNVHDEIIGVGPSYGAIYLGKEGKKDIWRNDAEASALFSRMTGEMRVPPAWCIDLPLDSEGGYAFEYSK
jgi:DNA polymerase bacteriophage-type